MLDEHVHCAACGRAIATHVKCRDGKTKPAPVAIGAQQVLVPGPNGQIAKVERRVPLCGDCFDEIKAVEEKAEATSKLIVPGLSAVK